MPFVLSAGAVALLASVVGRSVDQLGDKFGPGATGVLQSALGNLPELFIALFALRAGLVTVVQSALIGSILGVGLANAWLHGIPLAQGVNWKKAIDILLSLLVSPTLGFVVAF